MKGKTMRSLLLTSGLLLMPAMVLAAPQYAIQATQPAAAPNTKSDRIIPTSAATEQRVTIPAPVQVDGPSVPLMQSSPGTRGADPPPVTAATSVAAAKSFKGGSPPKKLLLADATADVSSSPALMHLAASGAVITDIGAVHGIRSVFARSGDQFMVFQVAPDGQATVAGLMTDISVDQLKAITGSALTELQREHGLRSFFLRNGSKFQVFYATPDGQRLIPGVMWDATGHDVTKDQIRALPGTAPTAEIGKHINGAQPPISQADLTASALFAAVQTTAHGSIGSPMAPELWMFVDPQCTFSVRAMQELKPYVDAGRVRLNVIPLSILDGEDNGLSTRNALSLVSLPPDELVPTWMQGAISGNSTAEAGSRLQANMATAMTVQLKGTPTFVWRRTDGTAGRLDGVPTDINALLASIDGSS